MSYSSTNPARKVYNPFTGPGGGIYVYQSTHAHAEVEAANFFAGCGFGSPTSGCIGMNVGDLVCAVNHSSDGSSAITWHRVTGITTSTGFASPINASVSVGST